MTHATTANLAADYIIYSFQEHGELLTNLKLQKLLYYTQGWYLGLHNKVFFDDQIEAWIHGPVVPYIDRRFKKYKYGPIEERPDIPNLAKEKCEHLDDVIKVYASYSAFELEDLTQQSIPWQKARGCIPMDEPSNNVISQEDMKNFFKMKSMEAWTYERLEDCF